MSDLESNNDGSSSDDGDLFGDFLFQNVSPQTCPLQFEDMDDLFTGS